VYCRAPKGSKSRCISKYGKSRIGSSTREAWPGQPLPGGGKKEILSKEKKPKGEERERVSRRGSPLDPRPSGATSPSPSPSRSRSHGKGGHQGASLRPSCTDWAQQTQVQHFGKSWRSTQKKGCFLTKGECNVWGLDPHPVGKEREHGPWEGKGITSPGGRSTLGT